MADMKQALTSGARPQLSQVPRSALVYDTRALEYGADKYARSNFYGPAPAGVTPEQRLLGYIDAAMRHLSRVADALNRALGTGGDTAAACATVDDDGGGKFPPSMLPDLAHAMASVSIGITCGVDDGLLPADPGQPWKVHPMYAEVLDRRRGEVSIPQKDDPDSERLRVKRLQDENLAALNKKRYEGHSFEFPLRPNLSEPKTTDYCRSCNESPESAIHYTASGHDYVDPRIA